MFTALSVRFPSAAYTVPPLTTISQSGEEMGQRAASLLLDMVEADDGAEQPADIVLEPTLIVRDSTAVARGA